MSYYKIRPRGGTASQWTTANPILAEREIGFEYPDGGLGTGLVKMKMGDGVTHWNDLPYATISPIVENVESTSQENVPSSGYVKAKFDSLDQQIKIVENVDLGTLTVASTGGAGGTIDVSSYVPTGYKIEAVIPRNSGGFNFYFYSCNVASATSVYVQLFRVRDTTATVNPRVTLILKKE